MAIINESKTPCVYFGDTPIVEYNNLLFKYDPRKEFMYGKNETIQTACASNNASVSRTGLIKLRENSVFYVPIDLNSIQKSSPLQPIKDLIPQSLNNDKHTSIDLINLSIALLLGGDQETKDKTLLFYPKQHENSYSFLDATLTWQNKTGDTIKDGVIFAIKKQDELVWANQNLLCAFDITLKKLGEAAKEEISARPETEPVATSTSAKNIHQQKIIFGPPGTGKSYSVKKIQEDLKVNDTPENKGIFRTTFHPEYSYGDFVAKLLPLTKDGKVSYDIHAGPFIQTLAKALAYPDQHFLLVIDEINRGNCAAIFGDIFQLLDRNNEGVSEYQIDPSELTRQALIQEILRLQVSPLAQPTDEQKKTAEDTAGARLFIPAKMSMIATMNTSDESVFYMDSAFKRRWQFQYIGPNDHEKNEEKDGKPVLKENVECPQQNATIMKKNVAGSLVPLTDIDHVTLTWEVLRKAINFFLLHNSKSVRRIEDKQLGLWFIKAKLNAGKGEIAYEDIKFKLMHFLWDNVFARDKKPLLDLLNENRSENKLEDKHLATFGQFVEDKNCVSFLKNICNYEAKVTQEEKDAAAAAKSK